MPDIARVNGQGVIIAVDSVTDAEHRTDADARTIALPSAHDMRNRIGEYRYDYLRGCFLPVTAEPLDRAERDAPGLVEGLVEFVETMERDHNIDLPAGTRRAIREYRRSVDGRHGGRPGTATS